MKMTFGLINLLILIGFVSPALASPRSSEIRTFADSLYREKDYYRAITEYKRSLHLSADDIEHQEINLSIGFSYFQGKKYQAAIPYFQRLAYSTRHPQDDAHFALGQTYFTLKNYRSALAEWERLMERHPKSPFQQYSQYQRGWSHFLLDDLPAAQRTFKDLTHPQLKSKSKAFVRSFTEWRERPQRSPLLAGILSGILPGAGQWYTGKVWDGISALLINGLFAYGIYYTFSREKYAGAGIVTFFGAGFYGGNIFSAVSSAHKVNRRVDETLRRKFNKKYGLRVEWNGTSLRLHF